MDLHYQDIDTLTQEQIKEMLIQHNPDFELVFSDVENLLFVTTIGVYNNGDFVINGVSKYDLPLHICYNLVYRPGRALFVNGHLVNRGYLTEERCEEFIKKIQQSPEMTLHKQTKPYN